MWQFHSAVYNPNINSDHMTHHDYTCYTSHTPARMNSSTNSYSPSGGPTPPGRELVRVRIGCPTSSCRAWWKDRDGCSRGRGGFTCSARYEPWSRDQGEMVNSNLILCNDTYISILIFLRNDCFLGDKKSMMLLYSIDENLPLLTWFWVELGAVL